MMEDSLVGTSALEGGSNVTAWMEKVSFVDPELEVAVWWLCCGCEVWWQIVEDGNTVAREGGGMFQWVLCVV